MSAWTLERDASDDRAYALLASDRLWNGYSIADIAPPLRQYTRVALAADAHGTPRACCLFYQHPEFNSLIPYGDPDGVATIFDDAAIGGLLPARTYFLSRAEHRSALLKHYRLPTGSHTMLRMAVNRATFRPPTDADVSVERLSVDDLPALLDLYAPYAEGAFTPDQLEHGLFYGVRDGARLLAAGGTHVLAATYALAAVGNIYTREEARGRGLGRAVTAAVTADLLADLCEDVILNVDRTNGPAIQIYRRLGFASHCTYEEASAVRRDLDQ